MEKIKPQSRVIKISNHSQKKTSSSKVNSKEPNTNMFKNISFNYLLTLNKDKPISRSNLINIKRNSIIESFSSNFKVNKKVEDNISYKITPTLKIIKFNPEVHEINNSKHIDSLFDCLAKERKKSLSRDIKNSYQTSEETLSKDNIISNPKVKKDKYARYRKFSIIGQKTSTFSSLGKVDKHRLILKKGISHIFFKVSISLL